jgi:hypothetical protein
MARERIVVLEQRAVPGVRMRHQYGVGQVLSQSVRVDNRNHLVPNAVDDERRVRNRSEIRETIAGKTLPVAERCHLRIGDLRSRDSVEILVPLRQSLDERDASGLGRSE